MSFWPGWMTHEVQDALNKIDAQGRTKDTGKKRRTVLMLADGLARGRSMNQILEDAETCAASTWFGKGGARSDRAWGRDAAIREALEVAHKRAVEWESGKVARALAQAGDELALAAVRNVRTMSESRDHLLALGQSKRVEAKDKVAALATAAKVAGEMLDRADTKTASKAAGTMVVRFRRPDDD